MKYCSLLVLCFVLVICTSFHVSHAYRIEGFQKGTEQDGFVFLGRFAYDANPVDVSQGRQSVGNVTAEIIFKHKEDWNKTFTLWEYTDNEADWPRISKHSLTCTQKETASGSNTHARFHLSDYENGHVRNLTLPALGGTRRRFHYIALVHCGGFGDFDFKLHFTRDAGSFSREFGVNETGLNLLYIIFAFLSTGVFAATVINLLQFKKAGGYVHPLLKLFATSVSLYWIGTILQFIHFTKYTFDGTGLLFLNILGDISEILATTTFMLLLLLLAQGWAISSGISNSNLKNRTVILVVVAIFSVLNIMSIVGRAIFENPAKTGTSDGTIVFYNILLVSFVLFAFFYLFSLAVTRGREFNPVKKVFMNKLFLFFIYLLTLPAIAVLSWAVDPWVREKCVIITQVVSTFLAYAVMLVFLWHTQAQRYFELENPIELHPEYEQFSYENI